MKKLPVLPFVTEVTLQAHVNPVKENVFIPLLSGNYLLNTYSTDDIVAETNSDGTRFRQSLHTTAVKYSQALWTMAPWKGLLYHEYGLKDTFIEGNMGSSRK